MTREIEVDRLARALHIQRGPAHQKRVDRMGREDHCFQQATALVIEYMALDPRLSPTDRVATELLKHPHVRRAAEEALGLLPSTPTPEVPITVADGTKGMERGR